MSQSVRERVVTTLSIWNTSTKAGKSNATEEICGLISILLSGLEMEKRLKKYVFNIGEGITESRMLLPNIPEYRDITEEEAAIYDAAVDEFNTKLQLLKAQLQEET